MLSSPNRKSRALQDSTINQGSFSSSHPVGCETLIEGVAPITADTVFVHGLRGHRTGTWTKDSVCWPQDLLSKEDSLCHIRVLAFGYDANIANFMKPVSQNNIFEHAQSLLNELARQREGELIFRPIIFVAHSVGGLVVKEALNYSHMMVDTQPHLAATLKATKGIVFLGTPHRGGDKIGWGQIIGSIVRIDMGNANILHDLERNSHILDRIGSNFNIILSKRTFDIYSFTEELPMSNMEGGRKVVENDSAVIGDGHERRESIHANHMEMVRFSSREDAGYGAVVFAIKTLLSGSPKVESVLSKNEVISTELKENSTTINNIPNRRVPRFVQREHLLNRLKESFELSERTHFPLVIVLVGMGGAGKTQLSLEYCLHVKESGKMGGIFWVDGSSRNAVYRSMEIVAKYLLPERQLENGDATANLVKDVLSHWNDDWLMVFDNVDDPSELWDISSFFPCGGRGSILVTSRHTGSKELGKGIEVDCMEEDEGLELLLGRRTIDSEERIAGQEILKLLGYLPLAIDQARGYISKRKLPLVHLVKEYEVRKKIILTETPKFWSYYHGDGRKPLSVHTTWEMSLSLLGVEGGNNKSWKDVLTVFAFFHPVYISENIFRAGHKDSPMSTFQRSGEWSHVEYEEAMCEMQELSLLQFIRRSEKEIVVSLHPMISEWLRMRLDSDSRRTFLRSTVSHLEKYLESMDHETFETRNETLFHVNAICDGVPVEDDSYHGTFSTFASFYRSCGVLHEAKSVSYRALAGMEKVLGPDHPMTLQQVGATGEIYCDQGRYTEAEEMLAHALSGQEKALGVDHTSTLNIVTNLAWVYFKQGRPADAEKLFGRAVAGKEVSLGPDHMSTLRSVNGLAIVCEIRGRYAEAEKLYDRTLAGLERVLGPDHYSTLNVANNLGYLYRTQGRLAESETLLRRVLTMKERALGLDHELTLMTAGNLGALYSDQGRLAEAEKLCDRALAGREKLLGPGHITTLDTVYHLGDIYRLQGRLTEAEAMYDRALTGKKEAGRPDNIWTVFTLKGLGKLYIDQGRLTDAERLYERSLAARESLFDSDDPSTLGDVNDIGKLYSAQGRHSEAEQMYNRALAGRENVFGPDNIFTLETVNNLATLYRDECRLTEAERLYDRALDGREKALGTDHMETLQTVHDLGILYRDQGRLTEAESMLQRALNGRKKALGPNHRLTLQTAETLRELHTIDGGPKTEVV